MVARKNNNVFGVVFFNESNVLVNSVCSTLIPFSAADSLVRRENVNAAVDSVQIPGLANERLILG